MARFGQGLIQGLINPDYAEKLNMAGMLAGSMPDRLEEEREKQALFQNSVANQQQFIRAAQSGDARLATEASNNLMALATKSQDSDLAKAALEQQAKVAQIEQQGALKGLVGIDKILANPSVLQTKDQVDAEGNVVKTAEEAREEVVSTLQARKAQFLSNPETSSAYSTLLAEREEATYKMAKQKAQVEYYQNRNAFKKQEEERRIQNEQTVSAIETAMSKGATAQQVLDSADPELKPFVREYLTKVAEGQAKLDEIRNEAEAGKMLTDTALAKLGESYGEGWDKLVSLYKVSYDPATGKTANQRMFQMVADKLEEEAKNTSGRDPSPTEKEYEYAGTLIAKAFEDDRNFLIKWFSDGERDDESAQAEAQRRVAALLRAEPNKTPSSEQIRQIYDEVEAGFTPEKEKPLGGKTEGGIGWRIKDNSNG